MAFVGCAVRTNRPETRAGAHSAPYCTVESILSGMVVTF